jgi:hypothetical protein
VNALANPEVGTFLNKHFVSSFQKVATFQIVNGQKQGGNVASYFCAPDGRVLHCVAGPVDGGTMLREAKWVVDSVKKAMEENKKTEVPFKALFRRWHAERLRQEFGLAIEPATFDAPTPREDDPLTYNDPTGRPVLPVLVLPPIDGPDVQFRAMAKEAAADAAPGANVVACRKGGRWSIGNQGRVHQLMSAYSMTKIEKVYATVFESILGERVSTKPVITINARDGERRVVCLTCESKAHAQD